jgi:hypothetical protein
VADSPWQDLRKNWYGAEGLPVSSSLPLPFLEPRTILVRDCYVRTFDRIWARAFESEGMIGTIITGQPGTGTCLLFYSTKRNITPLLRKNTVLILPSCPASAAQAKGVILLGRLCALPLQPR